MLIALDSSTLTLSLALVGPGPQLLAEESHPPPRKQSEMLPGALCELLARHGLGLANVSGYAVGLGPGSFTGLRIGLSTVKALAYAHRRPVGGVSSLAALALDGPVNVPLLPVMVARRDEVYVGFYRRTGEGLVQEAAEEAWTPAQLGAHLGAHPEARALGPAAKVLEGVLVQAGAQSAQLPSHRPGQWRASYACQTLSWPRRFFPSSRTTCARPRRSATRGFPRCPGQSPPPASAAKRSKAWNETGAWRWWERRGSWDEASSPPWPMPATPIRK